MTNIDEAFNKWGEKAELYAKDCFNDELKYEVIEASANFQRLVKESGRDYVTERVIYWYDKENDTLDYKYTEFFENWSPAN